MSTLILPCAGRSSRYPNMRPKWSLTHPLGDMMVLTGISGLPLSNFDLIVMTVLKSEIEQYNLKDGIKLCFNSLGINFELLELEEKTNSQSETVSKTIEYLDLKGHILVKDCDDYFRVEELKGDSVCVFSLQEVDEIIAKNKSYVDIDNNGYINTIVEKRVISDLFCCGGYSFSDAEYFSSTFNKLNRFITDEEIYASHIIQQQLLDGSKFKIQKVLDYEDWGTINDWNKYRKKYKTLFIDLDGVLVENSGEHIPPLWGTTDEILKNVDYVNKLYETGKVRIIITTSRKSYNKKETLKQLSELGIKYNDIIFDLLHCQRILINDFSSTNPYPTAKSYNLNRNSDNLRDLMNE